MSPAKREGAAGQALNSKQGFNKDGGARPVSSLPKEHWVVVVACPVKTLLLLREVGRRGRVQA